MKAKTKKAKNPLTPTVHNLKQELRRTRKKKVEAGASEQDTWAALNHCINSWIKLK